MRKKTGMLFITTMMMIVMLIGCTGTPIQNLGTTQAPASTTATTAATEEKPIITIDHVYIGDPGSTENFQMFIKDSPVYEEFVKQTGIIINEIGIDYDQASVRMASGDLGDLISNASTDVTYLIDLVEGGNLLKLNDLIEEYAPDIKTSFPERWNSMIDQKGVGAPGEAYMIPVHAGKEGCQPTNGRYLYTVRWDLYKQLGYPEMENPEDLLKVLKDMTELEPTNADGKKVYGTSFYVTPTNFFGFVVHFEGTYGQVNASGRRVHFDVRNNTLIDTLRDDNSVYWMAARYFNKAHRMGILDPDCFTQTVEDYRAKINSGEILCVVYMGDSGKFENAQLEKDPDTLRGFVNIPVEGCMFYQNNDPFTGWGGHYLCIPSKSRYPERIMQMIDYTFSYEGSRLLKSGVEGIHWDYVNGVPSLKDETIRLRQAGGDEWSKTGIDTTPILNLAGIGHAEIAPDGYEVNLFFGHDYFSRVAYTPWFNDFFKHYGISWPNEIFVKYMNEGKMYDLSSRDYRITLSAPTEEISRIGAGLTKIAVEAIPKLVSASSDEEFARIKEETIAEFNRAGAQESMDYWQEMFDKVKSQYYD